MKFIQYSAKNTLKTTAFFRILLFGNQKVYIDDKTNTLIFPPLRKTPGYKAKPDGHTNR